MCIHSILLSTHSLLLLCPHSLAVPKASHHLQWIHSPCFLPKEARHTKQREPIIHEPFLSGQFCTSYLSLGLCEGEALPRPASAASKWNTCSSVDLGSCREPADRRRGAHTQGAHPNGTTTRQPEVQWAVNARGRGGGKNEKGKKMNG